jgi:hypothetical protein
LGTEAIVTDLYCSLEGQRERERERVCVCERESNRDCDRERRPVGREEIMPVTTREE